MHAVPEEVAALGATSPLLIAGATPQLTSRLRDLLPGAVDTWDDVRQHVPVELADRCHQHTQARGADLLVCVGGGSATGLAKAVALRGGLPVLAVPTTYAGSEMTPIWGQSKNGVKSTGRDLRVLPATVVYDPELLLGLPPAVVGPSGMNGLAHCIEALYAPAADPLSTLLALESARLFVTQLPAAYDAPNLDARGDVLLASCLAGTVLGTVGTSLHHALCHLLGGMYDLPHAETHAIVLPHVLSMLLPAVTAQLLPLAQILGVPLELLPQAVWDVGAAVGTPNGLRAIGLTDPDADAAAHALLVKNPASPVRLQPAGAHDLLARALQGERPGPARLAAAR